MQRTIWRLVFAVAVLAITAQSAGAGQFKKAVYYHAGLRPYHVITADFNNDGNADLAFADWVSEQVVIFLGNGDGTFQKQRVFSLPAAIAVASGDFNEDGNLDLAVTQSGGTGDGVVTILLGDGKGDFHKSASYVIGVASTSVAVADFNGDGHLDVVVTDKGFYKAGDIIVFFGTGKGTLKKGTKYKMSGGPFSVAAQDLNGDDHPDLAVAEETGGSIAVLINDGTGKFLKPVTYNAGGEKWRT
jgi:FG-GAP-like repeat